MKTPNYVYDTREIRSIKELLDTSCELFRENTAFIFRENGETVEITYERLLRDVKALSAFFASQGLYGKKIAVTGKNSYKWSLTYLAVACGVGIILPMDKELVKDEINYIIEHSEASAVMISSEIEENYEGCAKDLKKFYMKDMEEYLAAGEKLISDGDKTYENHIVDPYAPGALLYTSGTTGVAKAVMLSQNNIASNIMGIFRSVIVTSEDRTLSVLPLHHTYECTIGFLSFLYCGASIAYNESLKTLKRDLEEFKPTIFVAVPLILERFHRLIMDKYKKISGGEAILAVQKALAKPLGFAARKKIFSAVTEAFGGRMRLCLCGAAPLDPEIFRDLELFGIKTYIGYGLTETAPLCLMHSDFYRNPDDNGKVIVGTQVKLVDVNSDGVGEIAFKGPNVMLGYYKNEEESAKVLRDGWFLTGDLAVALPNDTYKIVGRVKSMIVSQNGKKIFPEELEGKLCESKYVSECLVFGAQDEGKVIVTASVYPDEAEVERELSAKGITSDSPEYDKATRELIMSVITDFNDGAPSYKIIRRLIVRKEEFTKTTTKKIKRTAPENLV